MPRRKEFKKQAYHEQPNSFSKEDQFPGKWRSQVFGNEHPLVLEVGCGKADFSLGMAARYPNTNFVGVDLKADRLYHAAINAQERKLENVAWLRENLLLLEEHFAAGEVAEIWITFPDPFPKSRQAKHRMMNATFLDVYAAILKAGGRIHYKTDNLELFQYSLEEFVCYRNLRFHELTFDLHGENDLPDDVKIKTAYEQKFLDMGKTINYVSMTLVD